MRLESEAPQTQFETEVENILVANGYVREEIQFRDNDRYLRIGYWDYLPATVMSQLGNHIKETVELHDDDCGPLCFYELNH